MSNDSVIQGLVILLVAIFILIIILFFALIFIRIKEKKSEKIIGKSKEKNKNGDEEEEKLVKKTEILYSPESILDFMELEKIEDNMIIQKRGKFLMVVECQGINYDLMSEMEKASVEQGFFGFLNSLRYSIQLYIQTRTINLERSVNTYKNKLREIERKYNLLVTQYETKLKSKSSEKEEIEKIKYELVKQKNLKEYTEDIIKDVERQSLNRSILSKRYFVIIPCYESEISTGDFDKTEVKNMAFSELYTRSRAIINSLFACQVTGRILNSEELTELLYVAYNRDEADLFWMEKMKEAGFGELYSTAPDVIEKKVKLLDKEIEEKAISRANEKINEARRDKEIEIIEKEANEEKFVNEKAKELIKKHRKYIGDDIATRAMEKIEETQKKQEVNKEEIKNVNVQEKGKRYRARKH